MRSNGMYFDSEAFFDNYFYPYLTSSFISTSAQKIWEGLRRKFSLLILL